MAPKDLIKLLEQRGFVLKGIKITVVPVHKKDLPRGTFYSILRQAGIDKDEI